MPPTALPSAAYSLSFVVVVVVVVLAQMAKKPHPPCSQNLPAIVTAQLLVSSKGKIVHCHIPLRAKQCTTSTNGD